MQLFKSGKCDQMGNFRRKPGSTKWLGWGGFVWGLETKSPVKSCCTKEVAVGMAEETFREQNVQYT